MYTISLFHSIENNHALYRCKDCIKQFCESLREHTMEIIDFKQIKKEVIKKNQEKSYQNTKIFYIRKETFEDKCATDKNYSKDRDHCHYTGQY